MGDEITQVVFEIGKWNKPVDEIKSDIDKLIYVMKITETLKVTDTFTPPKFWSEEWIQSAIRELDLSKMSPAEREYAERQIVKAVQYADSQKEKEEAIRAEEKAQREKEKERRAKEKERREKERERREKEKLQEQLTTSAINLLHRDRPAQEIAEILNISLKEVLKIKKILRK